ncbi:MAG TPA: hypothetical protein VGI88_12330, partial [Verrucomicrobiae bacterium]
GEKLAAFPPGVPMNANFTLEGDAFAVSIREMHPVPRSVFWTETATAARPAGEQARWANRVLDGAYAALDRIEADIESDAPAGKIELANLPLEHARYFFCREQLKRVDNLARVVERGQEAPRQNVTAAKLPKAKPTKLLVRQFASGTPKFDRQVEAIALRHDLAELNAEVSDVPDSPLIALLREVALLEAMAAKPMDDRPALLTFRAGLSLDIQAMEELATAYRTCLGRIWGASAADAFGFKNENEMILAQLSGKVAVHVRAFYLKGLNLRRLVPEGAHSVMVRHPNEVGVVLVSLTSVASEEEAREAAKKMSSSKDTPAPEEIGPILQMITQNKTLTDFRTGLVIPAKPSPEEFRALLLSTLPLPPEIARGIGPQPKP